MMKVWIVSVILLPALLCAQEFQFRQEFDTIPVEINGWRPFVPWLGGLGGITNSTPQFCDIDADGDLDLFCGDGMSYVVYCKNTGTQLSADFQLESLPFEPFYPTADISFADIDNDGDKDGLFGYRCYYNIGSATQFNFQSSYDSLFDTSGNLLMCPRMATVDINSDGDIDIFAGQMSSGQIRFYENIGSPTQYQFQLTSAAWLGIAVSGGCADPTFCDIDADGDLDLFVGNALGTIYFYRNDGDSVNYNFTYVTDFYDGIDVGDYASPEFADVDGDADYDLLVGRQCPGLQNDPGDVWYYENIGTPSLAQWRLITKNYLSLDVGYTARHNSTDIDADLDHDLFIDNSGWFISYYQNIGTPDSSSLQWVTDTYQDIHVAEGNIYFCDIDADADPDLFIGEAVIPNPPYPGLYLYQNRGTPQNASYSLYSSNLVPGNYDVVINPALADIDGDGDKDLFFSTHQTFYYYYENVGTPTQAQFQYQSNHWQGLALPGSSWSSCFYDLDDDGDLDLFLSNGIQLRYYLNMGTPQVAQIVWQTDNFLGEDHLSFGSLDIFDVDADGDGDFFLSTGNGGMVFYRNITGEASAPPPVYRHPRAGLQISLGPNPANPFVVASFELRVASNISLDVYDLLGRRVAELASGFHLPGEYRYVWDAGGKAAGMYFVRLRAGEEKLVEKVVMLK